MPYRESNKTYAHSGDVICVLQIFFITEWNVNILSLNIEHA